jgi:hypothetical protein
MIVTGLIRNNWTTMTAISTTTTDIEALYTALTTNTQLSPQARRDYAQEMLDYALQARDPAASNQVARLMDSDPQLDQALALRLNHILQDQPDAVYAFIRAHLVERCDSCWVPRLHAAASTALRIAITDGDPPTIINWLTLIAREPLTYELGDILREGIHNAQPRAAESPDLAKVLIAVAAKREPAVLESLLADEALLAALPDNFGDVIRDFAGDPLALLQQKGLEVFMVGMARAARACAGSMFTTSAVAAIWELYASGQIVGPPLPASYQAESIIQTWVEQGVRCLHSDALETLATMMLTNHRDDLFLQVIHQERGAEVLLPRLIPMLERSHRTMDDALSLIAKITHAGDMNPQQAVDSYVAMLADAAWGQPTLPLIQQLARTLQKYPAVHISPELIWRMAETGQELDDDLLGKIALKRVLAGLETLEDETEIIDALLKVVDTLEEESSREYLDAWWRAFIHKQSISRLARLEKVLDGKRPLETERGIVQTVIAVRRMLDGRNVHDFAQAVATAYEVLDAIAEAFDGNGKRALHFDKDTAHAELDVLPDKLSAQDAQILANNLKELAQRIATMGDNRTRANLMRRGDDLDREFMSGEEDPHSAVDTMKWLAGYWGGTQADDEEDDS